MLTLLFSIKGSISRNHFLMGGLICICFALVGFLFLTIISNLIPNYILGLPSDADVIAIINASINLVNNHPKESKFLMLFDRVITPGIFFAFCLFIMWIQLNLIVKRLRDLKQAVWIAVLPFFSALFYFMQMYRVNLSIDLGLKISLYYALIFYVLLLLWPSRLEA